MDSGGMILILFGYIMVKAFKWTLILSVLAVALPLVVGWRWWQGQPLLPEVRAWWDSIEPLTLRQAWDAL